MKNGGHDTSSVSRTPMRFIFPTEERALRWAKRAAHWQQRTVFVVRLRSREFEIVKLRPVGVYLEISQFQDVMKWESGIKIETNGGLNHE